MRTPRHALFFGAFLCLATVAVVATHRYVMDDAFITFRYGKHLAEFGSATWNPPPAVQPRPGFTSIAWMLASALWESLTHDGEHVLLCARATSFVALAGAAYLIAGRLARLGTSIPGGLALGVFTFGPWANGLHVNSGMETIPFAAVVLSVLAARASSRIRLSYVLAALAMLIRPEGAAAGVALVVVDAHAKRWRTAALGLAILLVVAAVAAFALRSVFASALPSAMAIKVGVLRPRGSGVCACILFFLEYAMVGTVACTWAARTDPVARLALILATSLLVPMCFVIPIMNVQARYEWPALFLCAYGGASAMPSLGRRRQLALALLPLTAVVWTSVQSRMYAHVWGQWFEDNQFVGRSLRSAHAGGVLAVCDSGAVPYYAEMQTRDCLGLADGEAPRPTVGAAIACSADVTVTVAPRDPWSSDQAQLEHCGFTRRGSRPFFCRGDQWDLEWFSRDPVLLDRLPQTAQVREGCAEIDASGPISASLRVDTDPLGIALGLRLLRKAAVGFAGVLGLPANALESAPR